MHTVSSLLKKKQNYEARQPSYFATPAVQLIGALRVGLEQMHATPGGIVRLRPTPYSLHPTPYSMHPAPCTLHPTPYSLNSTP